MAKKLNIGSGADWKLHKGFDGMDIKDFGQKYVADILGEKGLRRFKDDEFDEIMMKHALEHFNQDDVVYIMNQVHRILKKDKIFKVCVPALNHPFAYAIGHKTLWTEGTFKWFEREDMWPVYGVKRWKIDWMNTNERPDIHCYLKPVK
jgi:predicted SAM-dependent methyltransferase